MPQIHAVSQSHSQNIMWRPVNKIQIKIILQCRCVQNLAKYTMEIKNDIKEERSQTKKLKEKNPYKILTNLKQTNIAKSPYVVKIPLLLMKSTKFKKPNEQYWTKKKKRFPF